MHFTDQKKVDVSIAWEQLQGVDQYLDPFTGAIPTGKADYEAVFGYSKLLKVTRLFPIPLKFVSLVDGDNLSLG